MKTCLRNITSFLAATALFLIASGCIRLMGQAGYTTKTPHEEKERAVGFDTGKLFEDQQTKGNVTT